MNTPLPSSSRVVNRNKSRTSSSRSCSRKPWHDVSKLESTIRPPDPLQEGVFNNDDDHRGVLQDLTCQEISLRHDTSRLHMNARWRAQRLEEIDLVQRAVASSKGETGAAELSIGKFNQLQTRKKHLRFARSPIHDWWLCAIERIAHSGEMIIEYAGEIIRAQVANKREKVHERLGVVSSRPMKTWSWTP